MKRAASGDQKKRAPLQVRKKGDQYIIADGNATAEVARRSGWTKIPVMVAAASIQTEKETKKKPATKQPAKGKALVVRAGQ